MFGLEHDLVVELGYISPQSFEKPPTFDRDSVGRTSSSVGNFAYAFKPTIRDHSGQRWIKRSRAQLMAMLAQLI
ncbi:MAG TPA: hypothetical protein VG963_07220, partial [Polyangiaceae bacterium]|nr:hypothetical protein [Polyangiaceae bacterium]